MAIRPVQEQWTIYVKGLTGEKHSFAIEKISSRLYKIVKSCGPWEAYREKDSTVRKLYRQVRKTLRATSSIKIILETASLKKDIPKSDEKISAVGITNNCLLYIIVEQVPDMFKVTLNFSARFANRNIFIAENKSTADLFQEVKSVIASSSDNSKHLPMIGLLCGDIPITESRNTLLHGEIFDGIELNVQVLMITVLVDTNKKVSTVNISPDATVAQFYQEAENKLQPLKSNEKLRLIMGKTDLRENSTQSLQDVGIHHGSIVFAVIRVVGGSDPRIQWLLECEETTIAGVKTPLLRACPHCGGLVQHTGACKHMTCPACSKEFCFICLSKRENNTSRGAMSWLSLLGQTGWQCGRYNTPCAPAPRQTKMPG